MFSKYNEVASNSAYSNQQYEGHKLAIFNSANYIEIAIYRSNLDTVGGACSLLGLAYRDTVTINFINEPKQEFTTLN